MTSITFAADNPVSNPRILKTGLAQIRYTDDQALSDFIWRISGRRFSPGESGNISPHIDRLIERVESVLDMHPNNFGIIIELYPKYTEGNIAAYMREAATIRVYADRITDGVLAHEIAHAVIARYFEVPPPEKVQEILAQYVDRHLWEDYEDLLTRS